MPDDPEEGLEVDEVTSTLGSKQIEVDVRVIAATNKDLEREIDEGDFREDLFYRLNVVPIQMPPLRERRDDIPMLVQHFTDIMTQREGMSPRSFETAAIDRLQSFSWAGNVRELRNTVERLLILAAGDSVRVEDVDLLATARSGGGGLGGELLSTENFSDFKDGAERAYIQQKLRENDWNVAETARRIDMPRSNLYKKIEKYGLLREG